MKKLRQPVPAGTKCGQKKLPHFNVMFWLAMFIFLICNVAYGQVPGYSYRVKITIDGSQVCGASNLINFPILIQHTAPFLRPTPNGLISNVNGYDIVFTAADGSTLLSHQIDHYTYNATDGTYAAWVKIPSLAPGADTDIYMYYGNSSVVTNTSTTATWDANYRTVYHLQSSSFSDATANSINSTNNGTTTFAASKIGEGRDFGGNDYIQTNSNDLKTANNFTVSAWFKADVTSIGHLLWEGISSENGWGDGGAVNTTTGQEMNLSVGYCCPPPSGNAQGGYLSAYLGHTEEQVEANGLTAEMVFTDVTNWHYVTATYSNLNTTPQVSLYLDGVLIDTDNGSTASNAVARNLWDTNLRIGRPGANQRQFNGQMDEVRISNIARSADWQCTEYNNQNNPGGGLTLTNDAPDLSSIEGTTLNFTEGDPATSITSAITITDENDGFLSSATVQITGNYLSTEDVLAFTNAFGITGSWNSGTGTLTLTGTATLANYQSALRSVTYQNTSANNPSTLTRTVSFKVNDGVSDSNIVTRNISVAGTNDAPVLAAIEGAALAYSESQAATAITATTTVSDVDNANIASATIQITGNYLGSEDVLAFTNAFGITGSWNVGTGLLTLTGSTTLANYQTALRSVTYQNTNNNNPSTLTRTISFQVNDGTDNSNTVTRDIAISGANDAPVLAAIEGAALAYSESQAATAITTTTTVSDVDNANIASATVQITGNYIGTEDVLGFTNAFGITGSWNAGTGLLTLTGSTTLANYQTALRSVTYQNTNNNNPSTLTRTVSFTVNDGATASNTVTRDIAITGANDAPVLAAIEGAALTYTEGQGVVAITSSTTVGDVDNTNIASATAQITGNYLGSEDVLAFTNAFGITGSWNVGTGLLTLTGSATLANYQAALRSITYQNTDNNNPSTLTRTVSFQVNDGTDNSNTITRDIAVSGANDAPVLAAIEGAALAYSESQAATAITTTTTVSDVDNVNIASATIQITGNYLGSEDVLAFTNAFGITGSWNVGTGLLTLTGSTTLANYQTALRSVTYQNTNNNNPSTLTRTISFQVNDGTDNSNIVTRDIAVSGANDAPVLAAIEGAALAYSESQAATAITATTTVNDADNANIASATVQITGNYLDTEDVLAFTNAFGITGSWNAGTGLLTLTGSATLANYQTALRSVTYQNTNNNNPSTLTRTVSFTVNDGTTASNTVTRDIAVSGANDAPVLAAIEGAALAYSESQAATAITATTTVSDVDNANIASATIQITGNYLGSEDVLAFTNAFGITGSWNVGTGLLTLTGSTTLANYQTALRSVTYQNTNNNNPSTLTRTVSLTVNDGATASNTVTRDIAISGANDAPVLAAIEGAALAYTEGQGVVAITSSTTVSDVDNANIVSATIQITGNYLGSEDVLAFTNAFGITGSWSAGTGILTLTGSTTLANYQSAIRSVTYENTNNNNPSGLTRAVSFTVTDGSAYSNTVTRDINVTPANDIPVLAAIEGTSVAYSEGQAATTITATTTVSDADNANLASATIQITGNYLDTEDVLAFTNASGITGSWDAGTGILTLTGLTTLTNYQSALRSVTYQNTNSNNPSTLTRTVSFTVNDGTANSNTVTRDIAISGVNDAPVATNDNATTPEDTSIDIDVLGNDSDIDNALDPASVAIVSTAANGSLSINIATGEITYTADPNYFGNDSFTYTVNDIAGATSNVATVSITVTPVNDTPVAIADAYTLNEDTQLSIPAAGVLINDSDADGDAITTIIVSTTLNGSLTLNNDGSFTYTPNTNYNGSDNFTYMATDGTANSATVTVTLTITPVNNAPVAVNDNTSTAEDVAVNINVLINDTDIDNALDPTSVLIIGNTSNGSVNVNSITGIVTYTPNANYNGNDSFTYTVKDVANEPSNVATVNITITPANDAPVASNDAYTVNEDAVLSIPTPGVLSNDADADGDVLTAILASTTSSGILTLNANGSFTYAPNSNFNGTDTFTYYANDGTTSSSVVTVTITVSPVNDAPVAVNSAIVTPEDTPGSIDILVNVTDTDNALNPASITILSSPANGATFINTATGFVTYTPSLDFNGSDFFTYTISDVGGVSSNTATVNITVTPVNDAPAAVDDIATTPESTLVNINVTSNDSDPDNALDPSSLVIVSNVANGTLTVTSPGVVTYTPASGFIGNDTFTYTIRDMSGSLSNTAQVTIVVVPVNDPPVAVDDGRIVLNNGLPLTIDVLSNDSDPDNTINELTITSVTTPTFGSVNIENGTIVYQSSGDESGTVTFTYTIEDPQGLTSTAMVTIQYEYVPLRVSEGFSPNNDGNNDTWFIQSIESHPNNAIKVFDRWGLLVYQAKNYDNNSVLWDGRANAGQQSGNYLDQGTYYYVIDLGNKSSEFSGYVVIVR